MSQVSTTVVSQGVSARGYQSDGVFTAASALIEYQTWILSPFSPDGSFITFDLRNPFPMELIALYGAVTPEEEFNIRILSQDDLICADIFYIDSGKPGKKDLTGIIIPEFARIQFGLYLTTVTLTLSARRIALLSESFRTVIGA